jgi:hypothetical protein
MIRGKLYDQVKVVRLNLRFVRGSVSYDRAAFFAAMNYYISTFGIWLSTCGTKYSAAWICSVSGIYIHVERAQAKRTVIS